MIRSLFAVVRVALQLPRIQIRKFCIFERNDVGNLIGEAEHAANGFHMITCRLRVNRGLGTILVTINHSDLTLTIPLTGEGPVIVLAAPGHPANGTS